MSDFRPFCVDMLCKTDKEIRELHKMCVDAGGIPSESCEYWIHNKYRYNFMGVCEDMTSYGNSGEFNHNVLTLDQVSEYLCLSTPEINPVTSEPIKWTKAMQKEGIPLTTGMLALDENKNEVTVDYIGKVNCMVSYENDTGHPYYEALIAKSCLHPFPDEETPEQGSQREEFLSTFKGFLNLDPYTYDGDGVAEDMYDKLKHLFKY